MSTIKRELGSFLFIISVTGIGLLILLQRGYAMNQKVFSATPPTLPTFAATPTPASLMRTTNIESPDGKIVLIEKKQQTKDLTSYSYALQSDPMKPIFTKTASGSQTISVPHNTFSPDNTYVFFKEETPAVVNYYVVKTSGGLFNDGSQFINVQDVFKEKLPHFTIGDVTGWAAPDLLIVNTKTEDGKEGSSYWFVISSRTFLQLGTHF